MNNTETLYPHAVALFGQRLGLPRGTSQVTGHVDTDGDHYDDHTDSHTDYTSE
jgi:hypothetical protein